MKRTMRLLGGECSWLALFCHAGIGAAARSAIR